MPILGMSKLNTDIPGFGPTVTILNLTFRKVLEGNAGRIAK